MNCALSLFNISLSNHGNLIDISYELSDTFALSLGGEWQEFSV